MRAEASQQGHVEVIFGEGEEWSWREIQRGCFHSVLGPLQKITEAHTKMIIRIPGCGYMHIYTFFEVISFYLFFNFLKIFFLSGPFKKSLLNLLQCCFCFMVFGHLACGILAP